MGELLLIALAGFTASLVDGPAIPWEVLQRETPPVRR